MLYSNKYIISLVFPNNHMCCDSKKHDQLFKKKTLFGIKFYGL